MKRWMTPLATIAGMAVMLACASGQEATVPAKAGNSQTGDKQATKPAAKPAQTTKAATADKTKSADSTKDAPADDAEPVPLYNSVTLGYTSWYSSRNLNTLYQHGLVSGGFGISDLSLLYPYAHDSFTAFELSGTPGFGSNYGSRLFSQWGGSTSMTATANQFSFWNQDVGILNASLDKSVAVTFEQQFGPNFGGFLTLKDDQSEHNFVAPEAEHSFTSKTVAFGVQKQLGEHTVGATMTRNVYNDLLQAQPTTQTDRTELRYMGNWGNRLSTEGTVAVSRIQQQGHPDSWVKDYALSGVFDVTEDSTFGAHMGQSVLDLNSVQNAYVRKRVSSGFDWNARFGQWSLNAGMQHREEERVRADHSFVDVPAWNDYNVKLNTRINKNYRLGIKGSISDMSSAPVFLTDDPNLLYWSRKATLETKLSGGNEVSSQYLSYTYRYRRNTDRDLSLTWGSLAVGGSKVFTPKLLGYAEFASDQYSGGGASALDTALGSYFPASETFSLGLDFTKNARESLSAVLTSFLTQDQWGQQIALSYHRDLGKDRNLQITYSPWLQRDRLYDVDTFDARILSIKFATRF